jgi:hypothetical protein
MYDVNTTDCEGKLLSLLLLLLSELILILFSLLHLFLLDLIRFSTMKLTQN